VGVQQLGQVLRVAQADPAEVDPGQRCRVEPDPGPAATADLDVAGIAGVVADEDVLTWQRGELDGAEVAGVAVVAPLADQVAADQPRLDHVAERHRVSFGPRLGRVVRGPQLPVAVGGEVGDVDVPLGWLAELVRGHPGALEDLGGEAGRHRPQQAVNGGGFPIPPLPAVRRRRAEQVVGGPGREHALQHPAGIRVRSAAL
jgi:hypothetical protein